LNVCFHGFLWVVFDVSRLLNWDKLAQEEVTALWNWEFMKTDVKLDTTPAQPFSTTTEMFMAKLFSIGKTCLSIKFVGMTITDEPRIVLLDFWFWAHHHYTGSKFCWLD
jgi:hypothetical protein